MHHGTDNGGTTSSETDEFDDDSHFSDESEEDDDDWQEEESDEDESDDEEEGDEEEECDEYDECDDEDRCEWDEADDSSESESDNEMMKERGGGGRENKRISRAPRKSRYSLSDEDRTNIRTAIWREFSSKRRDVSFVFRDFEKNFQEFAKKAKTKRAKVDHTKTINGIAAALVGQTYPIYQGRISKGEFMKIVMDIANIEKTTYYRYATKLSEIANPTLSLKEFIEQLFEKKSQYNPEDDANFMAWLKDTKTTLEQKTMKNMMRSYKKLSRTNRSVTRQHVCYLLKMNNWRMAKSKSIDVKRVVSYDVVDEWFQNQEIRSVLRSVDPRLLFNADETELNRKGGAPRWVAAPIGVQPTFITTDHHGSHVSVFLMISATGVPVYPFALIHGSPKNFGDTNEEYIKCFHTKKGYMTIKTFYDVITTIFIPYVRCKRISLGLPENARAVLVVDGHGSRYHPETLKALRDNNIDLVIIPAHSSHLLQPLDLTLNKLVKDQYKILWPIALSKASAGDQPSTICVRKRRRLSTSVRTPQIIPTAPLERKAMANAAQNAVVVCLTPDNIESAWKASGLYPLQEHHPSYTHEKEKELQQQACSSGVTPNKTEKRTSIARLTGVLTTVHAIETIERLVKEKGKVQAQPLQMTKSIFVSDGPVELVTDTFAGCDDVGDYTAVNKKDQCCPESTATSSDVPTTTKQGKRRGRPRKSTTA